MEVFRSDLHLSILRAISMHLLKHVSQITLPRMFFDPDYIFLNDFFPEKVVLQNNFPKVHFLNFLKWSIFKTDIGSIGSTISLKFMLVKWPNCRLENTSIEYSEPLFTNIILCEYYLSDESIELQNSIKNSPQNWELENVQFWNDGGT